MVYQKLFFAAALALSVAALSACKESPRPASDLNRIVCLSGGVTEIVFALGAGDRVVAVDTSSIYPPEVEKLPKLGYHRNIPAEGILSLRPTLVLASEDTGPTATIDQIRAAGVEVRLVPEKASVDTARERVEIIATALKQEKKGKELTLRMDAELKDALARIEKLGARPPRAVFVYVRGEKVLLGGGKFSPAEKMLELSGAENAMDSFFGYQPLSAESLVAARPDVIVLLSHGVESIGGMEAVYKIPGLALTPAARNKRIIVMDDLLFSGFTHRLGQAVRELSSRLFPELAAETTAGAKL